MKTRWLLMALAIFAVLMLTVLFFFQRMRHQRMILPHAIMLADGRQIDGVLMGLERPTYLIQTESEGIIVPGTEIRSVDGTEIERGGLPVADRITHLQETFEDLTPDGTIELHSTRTFQNDGEKIIDTIRWGMAPHELWQLETYQVVDGFGNSLPLSIRDRSSNGGKHIRVTLPRPILPGESLQLTMIYSQKDGVHREGDLWIYRNVGNYPDNRLVTRSVRLPEGAEIVRVDPEPLHQIDSEGRPLVIWRRHFSRRETIPWEIRYRL